MKPGQWYDRKDLLTALIHDRHRDITWNKANKSYHVNVDGQARRLPGIHAVLDVFCKTVDVSSLAAYRNKHTEPSDWNAHVLYTNNAEERGKEGGTIVHQQMDTFFKKGEAVMKQRYISIHKYTRKLIDFINKNSIIPLVAEFLVFDELHLGFATRADMIVFNPGDNRYEVWELKTGYNNVFEVGNARMYGPLQSFFDNSNLSRALLQALFTKMAFKYRYDFDMVARVVLVNDDGVRTKVLPESVIRNMDYIYRSCGQFLRNIRREQDKLDEAKKKSTTQIIKVAAEKGKLPPLHTFIKKDTKEQFVHKRKMDDTSAMSLLTKRRKLID